MILQRLCEYYDQLATSDPGRIAPIGLSLQQISFAVVLNEDGTLNAIQDLREASGNRHRPRRMLVPVPEYEKRTSGIRPQFLWDKAEYILGWCPPGGKPKRVQTCYARTMELHLGLADRIQDARYAILLRFFEQWDPSLLSNADARVLEDIGGFGVFRIRGDQGWLHEVPAFNAAWRSFRQTEDEDARGYCLVTGNQGPIARLHPPIKGVRGGQTSGGSIVSFNPTSFESFGHRQGLNAPVGEESAFKYTTALNHLLRSESSRLQIGDTSVVFWADKPTQIEGVDGVDLFGWGLKEEVGGDEEVTMRVRQVFERLRRGEVDRLGPGVGFHVLGLAPNNARVSVRFWVESTLDAMVERVVAHRNALEIARSKRDREYLPAWYLARQTVRDSKDVAPQLGGALLRSILLGLPYPHSLATGVIRRIRADREISHPRAAILKAFLIRNQTKEVSPMLDPERPETAYHLGRLFAALEKTQEEGLPGIKATVKDRYYGSASATPGSVFPRLMRMSQHHVGKLEGGQKIHAERRIQAICAQIQDFPGHLGLEDQGLFALGYYHQRLDFFTPRDRGESPHTNDGN